MVDFFREKKPRKFYFAHYKIEDIKGAQVEVPEIISTKKGCFRVLEFFSSDSENKKNIKDDHL